MENLGFMNCEKHCWCSQEPGKFLRWASLIKAMKEAMEQYPHDHGSKETCSYCLYLCGKLTIGEV